MSNVSAPIVRVDTCKLTISNSHCSIHKHSSTYTEVLGSNERERRQRLWTYLGPSHLSVHHITQKSYLHNNNLRNFFSLPLLIRNKLSATRSQYQCPQKMPQTVVFFDGKRRTVTLLTVDACVDKPQYHLLPQRVFHPKLLHQDFLNSDGSVF